MTGLITSALLFIGPAYFANAAPLVLGGGAPLDGGRSLADGRPIFGPHKTVRGVIAGIVVGTLIGLARFHSWERCAWICFLPSRTHLDPTSCCRDASDTPSYKLRRISPRNQENTMVTSS